MKNTLARIWRWMTERHSYNLVEAVVSLLIFAFVYALMASISSCSKTDNATPEVIEIWAIDSLISLSQRDGDMTSGIFQTGDMPGDPLPLVAVCDTLNNVTSPQFRSLWAGQTWPDYPGDVWLDRYYSLSNFTSVQWVSNHVELQPIEDAWSILVPEADSVDFIGTCIYVQDSLFRTDMWMAFTGLTSQIAPRMRIRTASIHYNLFEGQQWGSMSSAAKGQHALALDLLRQYPSHKTFNWRGAGFDSLQIHELLIESLSDCKGFGLRADLRGIPVSDSVVTAFIDQKWIVYQ